MKASSTLVASCLALGGCLTAPAATVDHGEYLFSNYCSQCHDANAVGKANIAAPPIAALPEWYVTEQLHKFRSGARGAHFDDLEGMRMRPMSLALGTETDVQAVAMYVASLPPAPVTQTVTGNAENGKKLFTTCVACHGAEATGNVQLGSPPLTVQADWYMVKQLAKFKTGVRGANPKDARGAQMRPMAALLPDDQAMNDVVAYVETLRKAPGTAAPAAPAPAAPHP